MNLTDNNRNICYDNVDQYTSSIVTTTTTTTMSTANIQNFFKQRHQANARERYRTRSVNSAFTTLRQLIPTQPQNRKLSKIETLRLAKSYIEHLGATLTTGTSIQPCSYVKTVQKELLLNDNYLRNGSNICTFCLTTKSN